MLPVVVLCHCARGLAQCGNGHAVVDHNSSLATAACTTDALLQQTSFRRVWLLAVWPVLLPACTLVAVRVIHLYDVLTVCACRNVCWVEGDALLQL